MGIVRACSPSNWPPALGDGVTRPGLTPTHQRPARQLPVVRLLVTPYELCGAIDHGRWRGIIWAFKRAWVLDGSLRCECHHSKCWRVQRISENEGAALHRTIAVHSGSARPFARNTGDRHRCTCDTRNCTGTIRALGHRTASRHISAARCSRATVRPKVIVAGRYEATALHASACRMMLAQLYAL
jgi:hypothetical protein